MKLSVGMDMSMRRIKRNSNKTMVLMASKDMDKADTDTEGSFHGSRRRLEWLGTIMLYTFMRL